MSSVVIGGNLSGSVILQAPAVAGATTLTLPSSNSVLFSDVLNPGNTSYAPLTFTSGTNKTTATAGSIEYDGNNFYGTIGGNDRALIPNHQFIRTGSNYKVTNSSNRGSTNPVFGKSVTLSSNTVYVFDAMYSLYSAETFTMTFAHAFGGTTTLNSINYSGCCSRETGRNSNDNNSEHFFISTDALSTISSSVTAHFLAVYLHGVVDIATGGTFIPQIEQTQVAPDGDITLYAGSWFSIYPIGPSGDIYAGSWS